MGYGKARTRGPISKALAGKMSMDEAYKIVEQHYREGVANAGEAWAKGVNDYIKYYEAQIKKSMNDPNVENLPLEERMKQALSKLNEIASEYYNERTQQIDEAIIRAYSSAGSLFNTSSANTNVSNTPKNRKLII